MGLFLERLDCTVRQDRTATGHGIRFIFQTIRLETISFDDGVWCCLGSWRHWNGDARRESQGQRGIWLSVAGILSVEQTLEKTGLTFYTLTLLRAISRTKRKISFKLAPSAGQTILNRLSNRIVQDTLYGKYTNFIA